jgi:hypothetical protein
LAADLHHGGRIDARRPDLWVVAAATYDVTDLGITNVEPDLSEIASASVDLSAN